MFRTALLSLSLIATPAFSKSFTVEDPSRLVEVIDVVNFEMVQTVAQKIDLLSQQSSKPIDILINSPGGSVMAGTIVLDAMDLAKRRGVNVRCITGVLAASMAYVMLSNCNERYALPHAKLLFHPMSITVRGARVTELLPALEESVNTEKRLIKLMRSKLSLGRNVFMKHYYAETFWEAADLERASPGFVKIVTKVNNVPNIFVYQKPRQSLFFEAEQGHSSPVEEILRRLDSGF